MVVNFLLFRMVVAVVGSLILLFAFTLDCLDGQIARYTKTSTPFGYYLDVFGDRVRELGLWICLCLGYSKRTGNMDIWFWGMLAATALCLRILSGHYQDKALNHVRQKPLTVGDGTKIGIRVWIQRFFYFSIAERIFWLAFAAPLGMGIMFFKIVTVASLIMMSIFSIKGWHAVKTKAFKAYDQEE